MPKISLSILSANKKSLLQDLKKLEKDIDEIHIDVMDQKFVPNKGVTIPTIKKVQKATKKPLDIHLMIKNPERCIKKYERLKPKNITIHTEATKQLQKIIQNTNTNLGLAINPKTKLPKKIPKQIKRILIMTVEPGKGGQKLIQSTLKKIKQAKKLKKEIQADGGINLQTLQQALNAGANNLVIGSAIFKSENKKETLQKIKTLTKKWQN